MRSAQANGKNAISERIRTDSPVEIKLGRAADESALGSPVEREVEVEPGAAAQSLPSESTKRRSSWFSSPKPVPLTTMNM